MIKLLASGTSFDGSARAASLPNALITGTPTIGKSQARSSNRVSYPERSMNESASSRLLGTTGTGRIIATLLGVLTRIW